MKKDINIFVGDINININNSDLEYAQEYLNIMSEQGFISFINENTREEGNTKTCIDHIFIKTKELKNKLIPLIWDIKITDHYPIMLHYDLGLYKEKITEKINYKKYINYGNLNINLKNENWQELYSTKNVNTATNFLINKIKSNIENVTRQVARKRKEKKNSVDNGRYN